jgi:DpnII restriction endonuclease
LKFSKVDLPQILSEIRELPSQSLDEQGAKVVEALPQCVMALRAAGLEELSPELLTPMITEQACFLDFARLVMGISQDAFATQASELLTDVNKRRVTWNQLETMARKDAPALATLLLVTRTWSPSDVLEDRYKQGRGRAIAGITRGSFLEKEVASILRTAGAPFDTGVNYTGFKGLQAKCDFAIPGKVNPTIVIECKGFEATGSKLTDVLGDVLKIIEAKPSQSFFFLVTDGRGWHRRTSDLQKLVEFHTHGQIDMIYTRQRIAELGHAVQRILKEAE